MSWKKLMSFFGGCKTCGDSDVKEEKKIIAGVKPDPKDEETVVEEEKKEVNQ